MTDFVFPQEHRFPRLTLARAETLNARFVEVATASATKLDKSGGSIAGDLDITGNFSTTGNFAAGGDALIGGSLEIGGDLLMNGFKVRAAGDATAPQDLVTLYQLTATAFQTALPSQAGNAGKFVTTDGTNASWGTVTLPQVASQSEARAGADNTKIMSPALVRDVRTLRTSAKTGAYTAVAADFGLTLDCSGTWTLGLTAAATLGDGWYCYVRNTGSGVITIDPNGAETIDGGGMLKVRPGGAIMIHCNGATFRTFGRGAEHALTDVIAITGSPATIDLTAGFDGAFEQVVVRVWNLKASGTVTLSMSVRRASDGDWNQAPSGNRVYMSNSGISGGGNPELTCDLGTSVPASGEVRFTLSDGGVLPRIASDFTGYYSGNYVSTLSRMVYSAPISGMRFKIYGGTGTFTSGSYQVLGVRAL